ncbi:MAG: hypothetical protein ACI81V_000329 [Lentimonas sp.]|jgi:hypothetical protein
MIKRRPIEVFSLSFLDCLCCGFGAILLLFILSIGAGNSGAEAEFDEATLQALRQQLSQLEADIADQAQRIETARNQSTDSAARAQLAQEIQALQAQLSQMETEYAVAQANQSSAEKTRSATTRLLKSFPYENLPPIGLPAEATHVAFVIDTSGSMRNQITQQLHYGVIEQIRELLDSLPEVQSIQFLDTSGNYMLNQRAGIWLPDTPGLREQALRSILNYPSLSASDPEAGIQSAIRDLRRGLTPAESMSLYVIGDDFRGSTQSFLAKLDRLNPRDASTGKRPVSISAVGFPTLVNPFQIGAPIGNTRFANIMREIAQQHDGVLILKPGI